MLFHIFRLKFYLPLMALVISGCQTTQNSQIFDNFPVHVNGPVYTGNISPITTPINISFNAFGNGKLTNKKKTKTVSSNGSDLIGEDESTEINVFTLETQKHHRGVLWRMSAPVEETNDVIIWNSVRTLTGNFLSSNMESGKGITSNKDLALVEKTLRPLFGIEYQSQLKTGDALYQNLDSIFKDLFSNLYGSLGKQLQIKITSKVAGTTVYKKKSAILAFWEGKIFLENKLYLIMSAYTIIDIQTGVALQTKTNMFTRVGNGFNRKYQKIEEIDQFEFTD